MRKIVNNQERTPRESRDTHEELNKKWDRPPNSLMNDSDKTSNNDKERYINDHNDTEWEQK